MGSSPWGHKRVGHDLATEQQLQYKPINTHTQPVSLMAGSAWTGPSIVLLRAQAPSHCPLKFPLMFLCSQRGYSILEII